MTQRQQHNHQRTKPIYSIKEVLELLPLLTNLRELHMLIAVLHSERHLFTEPQRDSVGQLLNQKYFELTFGTKKN